MIAYLTLPDQYPCPQPLRMSRLLGEHHLLVTGGVLDQPVLLQSVRYAGYIDELINVRMPIDGFKAKDDAEDKLIDKILNAKREILSKR